MTNQQIAALTFATVLHLVISGTIWVTMNDPYRRNEWTFGKSFWWPLVFIKTLIQGLAEVLFTDWKRND